MMFDDDDDDGVEPHIKAVNEYYFEVAKDEPICFSILPFQFNENDRVEKGEFENEVYLRGSVDEGLYALHKKVVAWRLGQLDYEQPKISVLSSEGNWIELLNPRRCYKDEVARSILITVQMLHFVRKHHKNKRNLWDCLWGHLNKEFDKLDPKPTINDLRKHYSLIKLFLQRDSSLMKLKILHRFNWTTSRTTKEPKASVTEVHCTGNDGSCARNNEVGSDYGDDSEYTDDSDNHSEDYSCDGDDNDDDGNDTLCALCDDGGKLISCTGQCKRAFHPRKKDGRESKCKTLGYTTTQLKEIGSFLCKNCEYKQHQCFKCGELEPSAGPNAKVFKCNNPSCGHFYHAECVAKLLEPDDSCDDGSCELAKRIMEGMSFTCPVHWCSKCGKMEDKTRRAMQFAVCRRCPKSYHRECLPREISFETKDRNIKQRAWNLSGIVIIYCLDHEICKATGSAKRGHIKFPQTEKITRDEDLAKRKGKMVGKRKRSIDQCSMKSTKVLNRLTRVKSEQVLKPDGLAMSLEEDMQIEPPMVGATNQSSQTPLKRQKRRTSGPNQERSSRTSGNIAETCVDRSIEDNLLESLPTDKDTELDSVICKIPEDNDGSKENSSEHSGEEDATNKDIFHGNNEQNDVSGNLSMDLCAKVVESNLKSRVEISLELRGNVDEHVSITGQDKGISTGGNQMCRSMCEQESVSIKEKTTMIGSTKSSASIGGVATYHVDDNPPEKMLHVPHVDNMTVTKIIHTQPQYSCDEDQEVNEVHTCQVDPNSSPCSFNPEAMGMHGEKLRKKTTDKKKETNGNKIDLDNTERCNHIEDGKAAHYDHSSPQCPSNHKEPDSQNHYIGNSGLSGPRCNDNRAVGISEYKYEQSTGPSRRENSMHDTIENLSNPLVGTNSQMEQRNHSPNGQRTHNDKYEPPANNQYRHDQRPDSNGIYGPRSHVPWQTVFSPAQFDANRSHDPYSYPREFHFFHPESPGYFIGGQHSSYPARPEIVETSQNANNLPIHGYDQCNNFMYDPESPGYFIGGQHSSYPARPEIVETSQNANNLPIHGYDQCNNFMYDEYRGRAIESAAMHPPFQLNNNGSYQSYTHVRMERYGATYGGHNREYGVRSRYTFSLGGPQPSAAGSVMDKYAPHLEQTNNQPRS